MSEKQIDLDAMRAMADEVLNTPTHIRVNNPRELAANLYFATDEIEQLRKEQEFGVNANQDLMCELEMANAYIEELRKERDALLAFIQGETDACTNSHLGGPCGQCTARRAALAAQGDKPHD